MLRLTMYLFKLHAFRRINSVGFEEYTWGHKKNGQIFYFDQEKRQASDQGSQNTDEDDG